MPTRKNDKQKSLGVVGVIPEFIGTLAGITMVAGKWIEHHVRNLLGEKPHRPKQAAKTPVQIEAEKRITAIEAKINEQRQVKSIEKPVPVQVKTKKKSANKRTTAKKTKKKAKKTKKVKKKTAKKSKGVSK